MRTPETAHLSREEIIDLAVDAIVSARLLPGCSSSVPSQNRWGSLSQALERQVGGFLLHNVAGQAASATFKTWEDCAVVVPDSDTADEDFHARLQRKGWRTRMYTGSRDRRLRACMTLFLSTPLDHLLRTMQRDELRGGALIDLVLPRLNGVKKAGADFWHMANTHVLRGHLEPLFGHFGRDGEPRDKLLTDVRTNLVHQVAHLWFRLELPVDWFPFRLCRMVDDRLSWQEQRDVAVELFNTPRCCLDSAFSLKVFFGRRV